MGIRGKYLNEGNHVMNGEFVKIQMNDSNFSAIPEFWSEDMLDFGELVAENCGIITKEQKDNKAKGKS